MVFFVILLLILLMLNLWTFVLFGWDKIRAEDGGWRVSESSLLGLALVGGIAGAYAGRTYFRHKTRKKLFNKNLQAIGFGQLVLLVFCSVYFYQPGGLSAPAHAEIAQTLAELPEKMVYYPNCDAARAAGAAPISYSEPGYREPLDGDNDGIACEPYYGR